MVKVIKDITEIPQDKKIIIDFFADWCGPCKRIAPVFIELAEKFPEIVFLKVNVDEAEELAQGFEITSLPTFVFLHNGNIVHKMEGANLNEVITTLDQLNNLKDSNKKNKKDEEEHIEDEEDEDDE
jgi:thioredoxin